VIWPILLHTKQNNFSNSKYL